MDDYLKPNAGKQRGVFVRAKAGVIEKVVAIFPDAFALGRPGIEHQHRRWCSMAGEDFEHAALVIWPQVKEAVPCDQPVKLTG